MQLDYHAVGGRIDRRNNTRVGVDLFSLYSENDRLAPGRVCDLSLSGLCFEAESEIMLRSELDMLLKLDFSGNARHMRVRGEVIREVPGSGPHPQYGVAFTSMTATDRQVVDAYLAEQLLVSSDYQEAGVAS